MHLHWCAHGCQRNCGLLQSMVAFTPGLHGAVSRSSCNYKVSFNKNEILLFMSWVIESPDVLIFYQWLETIWLKIGCDNMNWFLSLFSFFFVFYFKPAKWLWGVFFSWLLGSDITGCAAVKKTFSFSLRISKVKYCRNRIVFPWSCPCLFLQR